MEAKKFYTFKEIVEMFSIHRNTIRNWANHGIIDTKMIGGKHYVTGDSLEQLFRLTKKRELYRI